jgi:hypothetical protein
MMKKKKVDSIIFWKSRTSIEVNKEKQCEKNSPGRPV